MAERRYNWGYSPAPASIPGPNFGGRLRITRNTTIIGGIDMYGPRVHAPAIVVDPIKYPRAYQRLKAEATARASVRGVLQRDYVLDSVFRTVYDNMRYSKEGEQATEGRVARRSYGQDRMPKDAKIELSEYIDDGTGVCREQSLAVGALLELFKQDGVLSGTPRIHRNFRSPIDSPNDRSGHQWVRYTNSGGEPFILDVAAPFIGALADKVTTGHTRYLQPGEVLAT